jgi:WD40 repeat protein
VEWSPEGTRLAVGLSSRDLAVCSYDEELEVWAAKKVGKYKAAVVAVCWHPVALYIATGSTDRQLNVWDVDPASPSFAKSQVTGDAGAWINGVSFSETGKYLACMPHDSTVRFKDLSQGPDGPLMRVRWRGLPFMKGVFLGDSCLIACGFDKVPVLFRLDSTGSWQVAGSVDITAKAQVQTGSVAAALNVFKGGSSNQEEVSTLHTNTITSCRFAGRNQFSTSGSDGQVALWEMVA